MTSPSEGTGSALFAQEGYAPADMLHEGLKRGAIDGVVLSPRVERFETLNDRLGDLFRDNPKCRVLFDPQLFLVQSPNTRPRHFDEYPYYGDAVGSASGMLVSPKAINQLVRNTLDFQNRLPLSYAISPSLYIDNLDSRVCQTTLTLGSAACEYYATIPASSSPHPLLMGICIGENVLQDSLAFHQFLDVITSFRSVRGFYLIVGHSSRNEYAFSRANMAMLLYMCHVLAVNGFEVHIGYTSWPALLFAAVGATSVACGWNSKSRSFLWSDYVDPQTGGRRPRPLFSCAGALSSVLVHPVLGLLCDLFGRDTIFAATPFDRPANHDPLHSQQSNTAYALQHWDTLRILLDQVCQGKTVRERLGLLKVLIDRASTFDKRFYNSSGVAVGNSQHLEAWARSIDDFVEYASSKGVELL